MDGWGGGGLMEGWMDGWMDGWSNGWMGQWVGSSYRVIFLGLGRFPGRMKREDMNIEE